ncbi:hypothetical protein A3F62_03240 [Candidatus Woesebacteria bacterium RIFCSPHIGHO2_12_FULL_44_11]|uniref:Low affinity iron permease family protein n=1 Tax=Candidatus Woesebacteria bacterium RIFCSPLOWO2_01_FULL_44_14 TaxID=1802525 RepID=A0A1F8C3Z8_9BACT|nr:MAG: hypothetical protein A3F62_03240 [Candidatus Woesebacteria bacterium RIFCSPHIGHO2_12_FULL_44_11]OGM70418.1 MAG: hypothetical protein A2975_01805 [Candidatus Woesebacteria bacterium RIFCSPLOWO2_01_FULL_44_14]
MSINEIFHKISAKISNVVGTPWAFLAAILIIAVWGLTGPVFGFSDTWQLVINTGTTIVTFLMVFLIQNTQNRDSKAIHLKLDELLKGSRGARNAMVNIEELPDDVLEALQQQFREMHEKHSGDIVNKDGSVRVTHEDKVVVKK